MVKDTLIFKGWSRRKTVTVAISPNSVGHDAIPKRTPKEFIDLVLAVREEVASIAVRKYAPKATNWVKGRIDGKNIIWLISSRGSVNNNDVCIVSSPCHFDLLIDALNAAATSGKDFSTRKIVVIVRDEEPENFQMVNYDPLCSPERSFSASYQKGASSNE